VTAGGWPAVVAAGVVALRLRARVRAPARRVAALARRPAGRRPRRLGPGARRVAAAVAAFAILAVVSRALALLVPAVVLAGPRLQAGATARRARREAEADLPEVVDLLRLAVGAGLTVPLAVAAVGARADGPVARALAAAAQASRRGVRLADALERVPEAVGDPVRPLIATLTGSERYGHAIGPALERLAAECRNDQRRRAEAAARRVPVLLLFPLVLCILPAFALLTVAPLLVGALRSIRL